MGSVPLVNPAPALAVPEMLFFPTPKPAFAARPTSALHCDSAGLRGAFGQSTRGPINSARVLSLAGLAGSVKWCPPTNVGTTRDRRRDGFAALHLLSGTPAGKTS